jgi:hypothetical protein
MVDSDSGDVVMVDSSCVVDSFSERKEEPACSMLEDWASLEAEDWDTFQFDETYADVSLTLLGKTVSKFVNRQPVMPDLEESRSESVESQLFEK